jgi:peptidoglycan-associated lipoprotein
MWCVGCFTLLVELSGTGWVEAAPTSSYIPDELLVKFKSGTPDDRIRRVHARMGVIREKRMGYTGIQRLRLPPGLSVDSAVAQYRSNPDVEYAEPNYIRRAMARPLDPAFSRQWGLHNTGQDLAGTPTPLKGIPDDDIDAEEAWDIVQGSPGMVIAVIDSGVDYNHPDLGDEDINNNGVLDPSEDVNNNGALDPGEDTNNNGILDPAEDQNGNGMKDPGNIWVNPGEDLNGNGIADPSELNTNTDNDNNGYPDDIQGWNFVGTQVSTIDPQGNCSFGPDDPDGNNDPMDDFGHGTAVAGVIAAKGNNNVGVAGILWNAKIMPLKFLGSVGCGTVADEVAAIDYAVRMGARIITIAAGGSGFQQSEFDAIAAARDAGILVVAAAGNGGSDNDASPVYPASYDLPNVISVASSDFKDNLGFLSNYGKKSVHLAAPGDCIYTTMPTGTFGLQNPPNLNRDCTDLPFKQYYDYITGTSFAAAFVSGVAGLLLIQDPSLAPDELKAILIGTTDPKTSLKGKVISNGRLNAHRALTRDLGAGFSGGETGRVGCGGIDLIGGDGPVSPGTAAASFLAMAFPLLLANRKARKILLGRRWSVFFFILIVLLLVLQVTPSVVYAQAEEETEMTHQITLKMGVHLYRSSEYFDTNSEFFEPQDLTSLSEELEYDYLWFSPSTISIAVGQYGGKTDFKTICCSQVEFRNRYLMTTLKFHFKPVKLKPFEFYLGPGLGYNRFDRKITVSNSTDNFSHGVFDIHFVAGAQVRLNTRLSILLESRYSSAKLKDADPLGDTLNIGGLTTYVGVAWRFPDFRHIIPTLTSNAAEEKMGPQPAPELTEERVIPPVEKPLEEGPTPEGKVATVEAELQQIHFGYDDWIIAEEARPILEENARWLQAHPEVNLVLEGYCDERGTNEYNLALGARRAEAVKQVLVTLGVSESRLSVISYGEERPLCLEKTDECYAKNRRVQFTIR